MKELNLNQKKKERETTPPQPRPSRPPSRPTGPPDPTHRPAHSLCGKNWSWKIKTSKKKGMGSQLLAKTKGKIRVEIMLQ